jgi:hypothetical protein
VAEFETSNMEPLVDCSANCDNAAELDHIILFSYSVSMPSVDGFESSSLGLFALPIEIQ